MWPAGAATRPTSRRRRPAPGRGVAGGAAAGTAVAGRWGMAGAKAGMGRDGELGRATAAMRRWAAVRQTDART